MSRMRVFRQCTIGVNPAAREIPEIKIEGNTTAAAWMGVPGLELLPVEPLPVDPLPVESLPVEPLPVDPLPVDSLPVEPLVLIVSVTPLVLVDIEVADRQDGHMISGRAPAVI